MLNKEDKEFLRNLRNLVKLVKKEGEKILNALELEEVTNDKLDYEAKEAADFAAKLEELGINEDEYWHQIQKEEENEVEEKKKISIMAELLYFEKRAEEMYDTLFSLLSKIDDYGLFPQCEEKLAAIKKHLTYAIQELEDIDCDKVLKKLEKMPTDYFKMEN